MSGTSRLCNRASNPAVFLAASFLFVLRPVPAAELPRTARVTDKEVYNVLEHETRDLARCLSPFRDGPTTLAPPKKGPYSPDLPYFPMSFRPRFVCGRSSVEWRDTMAVRH